MAHRWRLVAVASCVAVAAADLAQVALLPWRPKHGAALAGAALYLACAAAIARGSRVGSAVVAVMPAVPLATLAVWAAGAPLPVAPDAGMLGVLGLQAAAAVAAVAAWRAVRP